MAPDRTALAGVGATGWASGSQTCSGTSAALMPSPAARSQKRQVAALATPRATSASASVGAWLAAIQSAGRIIASPSDHQNEIDEAGAPGLADVNMDDQPIGRKAHAEEAEIEGHRIGRDDQSEIAGQREQEEAEHACAARIVARDRRRHRARPQATDRW